MTEINPTPSFAARNEFKIVLDKFVPIRAGPASSKPPPSPLIPKILSFRASRFRFIKFPLA